MKLIWQMCIVLFGVVEGGVIIDSFPEKKNMISVKWNDLPDTLGKICLSLESKCGYSNEVCLDVKLQNPNSIEYNDGEDFTIIPNPNDGNFVITIEPTVNVVDIRLMNMERMVTYLHQDFQVNKFR